MTDRCPTDLKVNKMILDLKKETEVTSFENSSGNEIETSTEMHEFTCAVHPLLQFASEADKVLKKYEQENSINIKINGSKGESECHTFLRNASKLLFKDGTGDPGLLNAYLLKDMKSIPMKNFKGNRFNILFYNAAGVYLIRNFIIAYLEQTKQSKKISNDQELIQSDPISCPQNQKGNN